jgi:hypothetical protein
MSRPLDGYELIRRLLERGMADAALDVVKLLEQRERDEPRMKALEFELTFLRRHLRDRTDTTVLGVTKTEGEGDDEIAVEFKRIPSPDLAAAEEGGWIAIRGVPRLRSILDGELPSLRRYEAGERP